MKGMPKLCMMLLVNLLGVVCAYAANPPGIPNPGNVGSGFTPPSTDFSILFLSNIFGVVDGVLAGTGSQVMGAMFSIFNMAIMSFAGILILHAIMISTINTAQEGEFLAKKFSSLWMPLRIMGGVALLMPKATGYCLMQIFVMWVVVKGVGVADRLWETALGYMQRGGVLIQPVAANNIIPGTGLTANSQGSNTQALQSQATGAAIIATQQQNANSMVQLSTCLNMMQHYISELKQQGYSSGICTGSNPPWYCTASADLMSGADFISAGAMNSPTIQVPSPVSASLAFLNGLCGTISWSGWTAADQATLAANLGLNVDPALMTQAAQARTIAVQQMWMQANMVGAAIVENRFINPSSSILPLGVTAANGLTWSSGISGIPPLFSGVEMAQAAASYLGIMAPTLNALANSISASSSFINGAKAKGWIMAGTYFFEVASLNASASGYATDNGSVTVNSAPAFCQNCIQNGVRGLFTANDMAIYNQLLDFRTVGNANCGGPDETTHIQSVSSYLCNTNILKSLGQLGTQTPQFVAHYQVNWQTIPYLPEKTFSGGFMNIPGILTTLGYKIIRIILNLLLKIMNEMLAIAMDTIVRPIVAMTIPMFTTGLELALSNYTNPIIALTQMGNNFINIAIAVWLLALIGVTVLSAIPYTSAAGTAIATMLMPFVGAWLGAMFTAGASLAYYIPLMPYMLFTFGSIGWFIGVIESMVAAPLVALGIMVPEGEDVMGKSAPAMMLILNVFLRPGLMILGFVTGIILAYVGIWLLNTGFQSVITGLIGPSDEGVPQDAQWAQSFGTNPNTPSGTVTGFAAIIGIIFMIILYISMYTSIVKICLENMMFKLADDILVWLSGGTSIPLGAMSGKAIKESEQAVDSTAKSLESSAGASQSSSKEKSKKSKGKAGGKGGPKGGGGR